MRKQAWIAFGLMFISSTLLFTDINHGQLLSSIVSIPVIFYIHRLYPTRMVLLAVGIEIICFNLKISQEVLGDQMNTEMKSTFHSVYSILTPIQLVLLVRTIIKIERGEVLLKSRFTLNNLIALFVLTTLTAAIFSLA